MEWNGLRANMRYSQTCTVAHRDLTSPMIVCVDWKIPNLTGWTSRSLRIGSSHNRWWFVRWRLLKWAVTTLIATTTSPIRAATIAIRGRGNLAATISNSERAEIRWRWRSPVVSQTHIHIKEKIIDKGNKDVVAQIGHSHINDQWVIFLRQAVQYVGRLIKLIHKVTNNSEFIDDGLDF